jgi:UDP-2,3-diacylglucosamine pyrophosphatase LpxH
MKALSRQQGGGVDFSQVRDAAKKKAQERADSVRSFEEEKNRLFYRDQARDDSVRQAAQHQAQQELRANQEKAHDVTAQIYAMLDENKINDAYKKFLSVQKPLEKYLAKDAFDLLKSTVLREYLTMAVENTGSSGFTDLPGENQSSANANPQTSADMRRNQEKAQQVISQIYGLLDAKDVDAAYRRFCEVRAPLEKYLCREAFTMLETSVLQAYESVRGRMMK